MSSRTNIFHWLLIRVCMCTLRAFQLNVSISTIWVLFNSLQLVAHFKKSFIDCVRKTHVLFAICENLRTRHNFSLNKQNISEWFSIYGRNVNECKWVSLCHSCRLFSCRFLVHSHVNELLRKISTYISENRILSIKSS